MRSVIIFSTLMMFLCIGCEDTKSRVINQPLSPAYLCFEMKGDSLEFTALNYPANITRVSTKSPDGDLFVMLGDATNIYLECTIGLKHTSGDQVEITLDCNSKERFFIVIGGVSDMVIIKNDGTKIHAREIELFPGDHHLVIQGCAQ